MLARFAQCWGSLEASRGGMLEVIGAVGSMLQALLLLFYFFAAMLVHLAAFSLPFDLGRSSFWVMCVKHRKNHDTLRSDKCRVTCFLFRLTWAGCVLRSSVHKTQ